MRLRWPWVRRSRLDQAHISRAVAQARGDRLATLVASERQVRVAAGAWRDEHRAWIEANPHADTVPLSSDVAALAVDLDRKRRKATSVVFTVDHQITQAQAEAIKERFRALSGQAPTIITAESAPTGRGFIADRVIVDEAWHIDTSEPAPAKRCHNAYCDARHPCRYGECHVSRNTCRACPPEGESTPVRGRKPDLTRPCKRCGGNVVPFVSHYCPRSLGDERRPS